MAQTRGKIKTVINYEEYINSVGVCCETDGTKTSKTFSDCLSSSGYWTPNVSIETHQCPQPNGTGFCCSCNYTSKNTGDGTDWADGDGENDGGIYGIFGSSNGIQPGISKCECEYYGGNWSPVEPDGAFGRLTLCSTTEGIEGRNDVRFPYACCHCQEIGGEFIRVCKNVCSAQECAELNLPDIPDCESVFISGSICNFDTLGGQDGFECGTEIAGCTDPEADNYNPDATVDDGSCVYEPGPEPPTYLESVVGDPFDIPQEDQNRGSNKNEITGINLQKTVTQNEETSACCVVGGCIRTTRLECERQNGFFIDPDESGPVECDRNTCPQKPSFLNNIPIPPTISADELPNVGDTFAGGIYLGIFNPGISKVKINLETGEATDSRASEKSGIGADSKWALIMCLSDLGDEFGLNDILYQHTTTSERIDGMETSTYDGLLNTYGASNYPAPQSNFFKQVRGYNRFSFRDWYFPSIQELGFMIDVQRELDFTVGYASRYSQNRRKLLSYRPTRYSNPFDPELYFPYLSSTRSNTLVREFANYPAANLVYSAFAGPDNTETSRKDGLTMLTGLDNKFKIRLVRRINII